MTTTTSHGIATSGVRVGVLGAGPAGLTVALAAARRGHEVVVYEAGDRVGGMSGSIEVSGMRVDMGSHRLHPVAGPDVEALFHEALGADLQRRPRRGRILLEGRWLDFPLRPADMLAHLPRSFALGAVRDMATGMLRATPGPDANAHATLVARLGPTVAERFYRPYLTKLYGIDPTQLHREVADRRVAARRAIDVVARMVRPGDAADFRYPRRGFGQLSEGLAGLAGQAGATVVLGTAATRVVGHPDHVVVGTSTGDHAHDVVVSTLPAALLARIGGADDHVVAATMDLVHAGLRIVHVTLGTRRASAADALYLPGLDTPISRLSEPRNYRDDPDDPDDHTVLCAEVPWRADLESSGPGDDPGVLADHVVDVLARLGSPDSGLAAVAPVLDVQVTNLARVYPVYTRASRRAMQAVEAWATSQPRILTIGRQGLFTPDNTHHVMAMGLDAAAVIDDQGGFDQGEWRRRRDLHRRFVVAD